MLLNGISPGALALKLRRRFGHGLTAMYFRDVVRPRILRSLPIALNNDDACEIHALTSADDWLNLVWCLKSFYRASGARFALCLHDDGTLDATAASRLREHFPAARFVGRAEADAALATALDNYPRSRALRAGNILSLKVFDFAHFLAAQRMLLVDSDVLFFARPRVLLDRIGDPNWRFNSFNRDVASAYTVAPETVKRQLGFELQPSLNSGLALVHRESLRLDWFEDFLGLPGILGHFWRIEQTLLALASSKFGHEPLPEEYDVRLDRSEANVPARHYVGAIRHRFYAEGIRRLVKDGLLAHVKSSDAAQ